jgi:hypothetical protein
LLGRPGSGHSVDHAPDAPGGRHRQEEHEKNQTHPLSRPAAEGESVKAVVAFTAAEGAPGHEGQNETFPEAFAMGIGDPAAVAHRTAAHRFPTPSLVPVVTKEIAQVGRAVNPDSAGLEE